MNRYVNYRKSACGYQQITVEHTKTHNTFEYKTSRILSVNTASSMQII